MGNSNNKDMSEKRPHDSGVWPHDGALMQPHYSGVQLHRGDVQPHNGNIAINSYLWIMILIFTFRWCTCKFCCFNGRICS